MKKIIFIFSFAFVSFQSFANTGEFNNTTSNGIVIENLSSSQKESLGLLNELKLDKVSEASYNFAMNEDALYDCEITVKGDFEGNQVDIVVTIHDVSWAGCQTLKAAVKVLLATM